MANIKSQIKRARTNEKKAIIRKSEKSELKTAIKNVTKAVDSKDKEAATVALNNANKLLDESIVSHVKNKNYVARKKSRLQKAVNSIEV